MEFPHPFHRLHRPHRHGLDHYIPGGTVEHGHPSAAHLAHHASLNESSQEIVDLLAAKGDLPAAEISQELDLDEARTAELLRGLDEEDLVRLEGEGPEAKYHLTCERHQALLKHAAQPAEDFNELRGKVIKRVALYARYRLIAIGIGYLIQVLLARHMGAHDYGVYSIVVANGAILSHFVTLGFPTTALRFLPIYEKENEWELFKGMVKRSFQITLALSILVFVVGVPIVLLSDMSPGLKLTYLIGFLLAPLTALTDLSTCLMEAEKKFESTFFLDIFLAPLLLLLAVVLAVLTFHSVGHLQAIIATVAAQVVLLAIMLVAFLKTLDPHYHSAKSRYKTMKWFKMALPVLIMTGFMIIIYRADLYMVGLFLGHKKAGVYAAALNISGMLALFIKASDSVTNPEIGPMYKRGDLGMLQRLMSLVAQISFWPTLAGGALVIVFGRYLLHFFGQGFEAAYWPLVLLTLSWVIKAASGSPGFLLLMTGNQMKLVKNYVLMIVLDILFLLVLTWKLGMVGTALGSMAALVLSRIALVFVGQETTQVHTSILASFQPDLPDRLGGRPEDAG